MSTNEQTTLFRQKTMDRISSPEDLTDYLKVTNPGTWIILAAVIILLAGLFVWSCVGTLETTATAAVVVEDHTAFVVLTDSGNIDEGMILRVSSEQVRIAGIQTDEYGRNIGKAEIMLPDGTYEGTLVTDQIHPISFLINAGNG